MELGKCKSRKCSRSLPKGYKHKHCESCRNKQVKRFKDAGKAFLTIGGFAIMIATKGRINPKK